MDEHAYESFDVRVVCDPCEAERVVTITHDAQETYCSKCGRRMVGAEVITPV